MIIGKPKILVLDIETKPAKVYTWRMYDTNIGVDQIIEPGGTICFGANWVGSPEIMFFSEWEHGHVPMLEAIHALLSEADAVVTYNGDKFDLQKLMGEFILNGLAPPPPPTSIDLYKTVRKMGFDMNRLAFIGPLLGVGSKIKHEGFPLWAKVMAGCEAAQKRMKRYCMGDIRVTARLYKKVMPFIRNHPHMGDVGAKACGACGSEQVQSRGYRRTKGFRIQRLQCQNCGSWQDGIRRKV